MNTSDIHSFSRPDEVVVKHLSLNLTIDFSSKIISGTATLMIENKTGTSSLFLDSRELNIRRILLDSGTETQYSKGKVVPFLGQSLEVKINSDTKKVIIEYNTVPEAAALQWLSPRQTAGGKYPFLFTQSQAILARTWIPIQDSPGIKFTYDAVVKCPKELMAVMSADNDTVKHADGIYHFEMPQPVPSYLMALAVGDLAFHPYNNMCGVFAEPVMMEKCAYEFSDLPKMISSAGELYGEYQWGRYDVLVLPPSFPFGGMENPRITFATPTIIAGDRSLVSLIAHELAHSWSGNLVTNATWNDFWINEGFTVYFESRIMEKIYGKDYADMLSLLSQNELKETIREMGDTHLDTKLYLNLKNRDPDEGVTDIAYQKGRFFLTRLEEISGRDKWDIFLKKYFEEFAFQSMTTEKFLAYLDKEFFQKNPSFRNEININEWIYGTGLPADCPAVKSSELEKAGIAAADFAAGIEASELKTEGWTTHHWLYFLRSISDTLNYAKMTELDKKFHFTGSGNSEILCDWLRLCIKNKYDPAYPELENFLMTVGRRKFLKPLYADLIKTKQGQEMALKIYSKARDGYHSVATHTLDEMLSYKN